MDRLIHLKIESASVSRRKRLPQLSAAFTANCVVLQKGFVPLQHAFALPQNLGGTFHNGDAVLPKNFAPVQDAVASFTRDFAVPRNHFAPLQKRFAVLQNDCGAFPKLCRNLVKAAKSLIFDDFTLNPYPSTLN